jgi:hypothetical protein
MESVFVGVIMNLAFFTVERSLDWVIAVIVSFAVLGFFTGSRL